MIYKICRFAFALPKKDDFSAVYGILLYFIIAFRSVLYYNKGMKLQKITMAEPLPQESDFTFTDKLLQGARVGKKDDALYIFSPRRYKLFTKGKDVVCILDGSGHFKWARGETPFCKGDCFSVEEVGEYELNGSGTFLVLHKTI